MNQKSLPVKAALVDYHSCGESRLSGLTDKLFP